MTIEELDRLHREASEIERKWHARETAAFYFSMSLAVISSASNLRWLAGMAVLALVVWVVLFVRHLRARRVEQRAWDRKDAAFYERMRR